MMGGLNFARGTQAALVLVGLVAVAALLPAAEAATGDKLRQFDLGGALVRGIAFDGTTYYLTRVGDTNLYKMNSVGTITGSVSLGIQTGAIEWDALRGKLWVGSFDGSGRVFLADPATGAKTEQFTYNPGGGTNGLIVGLSHDRYSDTLWVREALNGRVSQVNLAGVELDHFSVNALAAGLEFDGDSLWISVVSLWSSSTIARYDLDGKQLLTFSPAMYVQELALDPVSFRAGQCALWAAGGTAFFGGTGQVKAFEVPMPCGDKVAPSTSASASGTLGKNGWYVSSVGVTLSASDGPAVFFTGVKSTIFSLDGGASRAYVGSVSIGDGVHVFDYSSSDHAGNTEATKSLSLKVDTVAPSTTATLSGTPGDNGWYRSAVKVTLSATDATSGVAVIHCAIESDPPPASSEPGVPAPGGSCTAPPPQGIETISGTTFTVSGEGTRTVRFRSEDRAGNLEAEKSVSFRIDSLPPATTATLDPAQPDGDNGWYRSPVTVSLAASDATSGVAATLVSIDGGAEHAYAGPIAFTTDGAHSVVFRSRDHAGNLEAAQRVDAKIDRTPPATRASATGPAGDDGWFLGDVTVTLSASDASSGVRETLAGIDGGALAAVSGPLTIRGDGVHTVTFHSVDIAGNAEASQQLTLRIDGTPPVTTEAHQGTPGDDGWFLSPVTVTLSASDATSGVRATTIEVDGVASPYAGPVTVSGDGSHDIAFWSRDIAGNVEARQGFSVRIDTTPPSTSIAVGSPQYSDGSSLFVSAETPFELGASDATSGVRATYYRVNGGELLTYSAPFTLGDQDGTYTIEFHSRDVAGNVEAASSLTVLLDDTAPLVDITRPLAGTLSVGEHYVLLDTDGDGYPEPVEALLGSDPRDPASTPTLPEVLPATPLPGVRQEVGPIPVQVGGQTIVVPGVSQSFQVPVSQPAQEVTLPGVHQQVGPVEVALPATTIRIPAVGPFPPVVLELPERVVGTPAAGPVPAQLVEVPGRTVGPVGGPLEPLGTPETRDLAGKAYVVGGTQVPVRVASEDPVVNGVASGVNRVVFLVNGRVALVDASPPYEFVWDTGALPLGDYVLEAVSVDNVDNQDLDSRRAYVVPGTEEGVRATARPHVQRLAQELRAALAPAGADFGDANGDFVPDTLEHAASLGADQGLASARLRDAIAAGDADGDGFPDAASAAAGLAADAALPPLPSVPGQRATTPGVSAPTVPGQTVATPGVSQQVGEVQVAIPSQSASTPELGAPNVAPQTVATPGVSQRVGDVAVVVPSQSATTPGVGSPGVAPQTIEVSGVSPSYPEGVPTSCAGSSVSAAAGAVLVPTRVELPNGAFVVVPLPSPSQAAALRACGIAPEQAPGLLPALPALPAPPATPQVPPLPVPG